MKVKQKQVIHPIFQVLTKVIDLKGNIWLGLFSWIMMIGLVRCVLLSGPDLPGGALGLYGTVLASYGITRTALKIGLKDESAG